MNKPKDPFGSASTGAPIKPDTGKLSEQLAQEETSQLNVEIPKRLHKRLRVHCVQTEQEIKDVVAQLLERHLSE
jgi:hypothetical protein